VSCRQALRMKISRGALRSSAGLLLTLGSFGCGSGNFTPPFAGIALLRTRS